MTTVDAFLRGRRKWMSGAAGVVLAASLLACGQSRGGMVRVVVPTGSSMAAAADSLAHAGVIRSARLFRVYAMLRRDDRGVKPGTYLLRRGSSWSSALEALHGGKGIVHVVTIPEGYSLAQIVPLLSTKLGIPADSLEVAVRDTALLHQLDVPTPTLEGYLFPDTYLFPDRTTARSAVATMVRRFEQVWRPEWSARLDSIPMSRNDVVTLASIVEKEAKLPEERPVIAAVYMNRLRDHMLLQADPTVQYALGAHQARVYYKQLEVASPYNTYKHPGLPPGPIASPGRASLVAALYPANVPYLYFVALPDGHHEFRVDFASHSQAKREARRAWDSLAPGPHADTARAAAPPRSARASTTRRARRRHATASR